MTALKIIGITILTILGMAWLIGWLAVLDLLGDKGMVYFLSGSALVSIPFIISMWKDDCDQYGGLSWDDLFSAPLMCVIFSPVIFGFGPMMFAFCLIHEWFPDNKKPKSQKEIIIRCRRPQ